jgi:glycosyltransferase involved in cell wall biosynthesis
VNIAIVIPALNEAATVGAVVRSLLPYGTPIVVDDGSTDDTVSIARDAGADVVRHDVNRGYDAALSSGFVRAAEQGANVIVTFDADGQHDVSSLEHFIAPIRCGQCDLVLGVRPNTARLAETVFSAYTRWRFAVPDILCGIKAYRIGLYRTLGYFDRNQMIGTELALACLRRGATFKLIPVPIHPRQGAPRFARTLTANWLIFRAFLLALKADFAGEGRNPEHNG